MKSDAYLPSFCDIAASLNINRGHVQLTPSAYLSTLMNGERNHAFRALRAGA